LAGQATPFSCGTGYECLAGGGEMGALMRSLDWSTTLLGPVSSWPQSLRTSVSTCLNSRFAIVIWWGPDLVMLYNDAYRDIIAGKHPAALGRPGRECWPEIWPTIRPMLEGVLQLGDATWSNDFLLPLERNGYPEECYFTFSYSPIRDESGGIGGVFTPVAETTEHVIGGRRMRTLRDLASRASGARDVRAACKACAETLAGNPYSIPFAALYLFDEARSSATLVGGAGIEAGATVAPELVVVAQLPGILADAVKSAQMTVIDDLAEVLGPLPRGPWDAPTRSGVILPILMPGHNSPLGFVLAGANPLKRLDAAFRTFFELVGGHISSAVANARAYEEERQRARALAEIDRAKTAFFSNVSHEFRTPLTLMLGPLEAMLERAQTSAAVSREELQLVHRNGMRLLKMVNTLLDFSRIEAGRIHAVYEPTELATFTAEIASAFQSAMDRAGLIFDIDCPPLAEAAYIDRNMWEKIILNLVSNAFKFTLTGSVAVRLKEAGDRFELSVEDTGTGIPENELSRIFDRFHRVEGARGRTHEGTGIGLSLVQELSRLHGGSIRVESAAGKGSAFVVTIPKGWSHLPAEHLGSARTTSSTAVGASAYVDEALRWLPETERDPRSETLFAADTVQAPHVLNTSGRILLADDNADMREYVRRLLGEYYEIQAVGNGAQALIAARQHPPDLILTDVMMPELDGFGLLQELRSSEATRTIPVILLSARAGEDARIEGLTAGADDYIVKPFTARELLARVSAHLSMNRLRAEAADRERVLRAEAEAAHEHVNAILESISDAFLALDEQWRFTYVNAEAERTTGMTRGELIGQVFWDIFPETRGTNLETQFHRAMEDRVVVRFENYYRPWQRWFEVRLYPAKDHGVAVFYQDITKRKETEESTRRANAALRVANADLEQFAYSASHDLREPLRAVRIYCELLKQTYAGKLDSEADAMIGYCVDGAQRMSVLIDDLLAYTQASSDLAPPAEAVSLESALDEALLNLGAAIAETSATVSHDAMPALRVAPVHARQLFQNLIGNALKYHSAAPPIIHVGAREKEGEWIFSVQDNGIGIPAEYRETVFELCKRLHPASQYPGTGIGLAICKKLVERYGGRIWVESEPGKGATFLFSIPELADEEDRPAQHTPSEKAVETATTGTLLM
jgi:PAS domain S-box-containing protein